MINAVIAPGGIKLRVMEPPKAAAKAFDTQRRNAKRRGIPFLLTFEEWWDWWQIDNRWANRGRRRDNFVMGRFGDTGPYALDNIYCVLPRDNVIVPPRQPLPPQQIANMRIGSNDFAHLRDRYNHPRCRPVVSPKGSFPSVVLAAEANGLKPKYAQKLAARAVRGWSYAPDIAGGNGS